MTTGRNALIAHLEEELTERGWTLDDLADKMAGNAVINRSALSTIGTKAIDLFLARRIAEAMGYSVQLVLDLDKEPEVT